MYFFLGICQSMIGDRVIIDDSIPQIKFDRLLGSSAIPAFPALIGYMVIGESFVVA